MNKVLKYLMISFLAIVIIYNLLIFGLGYLYSHGAGGLEKIEGYEFKTTTENFEKELKSICNKSKNLSFKDTIENEGYAKITMKIQIIDGDKKINYIGKLWNMSDENLSYTSFYLYHIDNKTNDDFSWFSIEKYKKIKLFEKEILEPISRKYKYEKVD
jgi:hypothetical protein